MTRRNVMGTKVIGIAFFVGVMSTACGDQAGSFSVDFVWPEASRPDLSTGEYYAWARLEQWLKGDQDRARRLSDATSAAQLMGDNVDLSFKGLSYGKNRVVIVEVRRGDDRNGRVLFAGRSELFTLEAGKKVVVPVYLDENGSALPPTLGTGSDGLPQQIPVTLLNAAGVEVNDQWVADTVVTVRVPVEGARWLTVANSSALLDSPEQEGVVAIDLEQWERSTDGSTVDVTSWDLNSGLPATVQDKDDIRAAFVRLTDASGYSSEITQAKVYLDTTAPTVINYALAPSYPATVGALVRLSFAFDEAIDTATLELDAGGIVFDPVPIVDGDNRAFLFEHQVTTSTPTGQHSFRVRAADPLGNGSDWVSLGSSTIDAEPPALTGGVEVAINDLDAPKDPAVAAIGDEVFIRFTLEEDDLLGEPLVRIAGSMTATLDPALSTPAGTYVCKYVVQPGDPDGEYPITVSLIDLAGNETHIAEPSARVLMDATPPRILFNAVAPDHIGNDTPELLLSVTFTEELRDPLLLTVLTSAGVDAGWPFDPSQCSTSDGYSFLCSWPHSIFEGRAEGDYDLRGEAYDLAGNLMLFPEHILGSFELDWQEPDPPGNILIDTSRQDTGSCKTRAASPSTCWVALGDTVTVSFEIDSTVAAEVSLEVAIGTSPMELVSADPCPSQPAFTCFGFERVVVAGDPEGYQDLRITLTDLANNTLTANYGSVELDFSGPRVVSSLLERRPVFSPAVGMNAIEFSALDPRTGAPVTAELLVSGDEAVASLTEIDCQGLAFTSRAGAQVTEQVLAYAIADTDTTGTYTCTVTLEDPLGNQSTTLLPWQIIIDNDVLDKPGTAGDIDLDRFVLQRVPWGNRDTDGEPWSGIVDRLQSGDLGADQPGFGGSIAQLLVYDGSGLLLGAIEEPSSWPLPPVELVGADQTVLYLNPVASSGQKIPIRDGGGQLEDLDAVLFPVAHGTWVATMGGKQAGSSYPNPLVYSHHPELGLTRGVHEAPVYEVTEAHLVAQQTGWVESSSTYTWESNVVRTGDPGDLHSHQMAYDSVHGTIYLYGGAWAAEARGDLWAFEQDKGWVEIAPFGGRPPVTQNHGLAYDPTGDQLLLYAPDISEDRGVIWAFAPASLTWRKIVPTSGSHPTAGVNANMVVDARRDRLVVFVGTETWWFDLSSDTWQQSTAGSSPPAYYDFGLVLDPERDKAVLFGGKDSSRDDLGQTWELDLESLGWQLMSPSASPSARPGPLMAYDETQRRVLMYGGYCPDNAPAAGGTCNDMWEYQPLQNRWVRLTETSPWPTETAWGSMVFDRKTQSILLYGGRTAGAVGFMVDEVWRFDPATVSWKQWQLVNDMDPTIKYVTGYGFDYDPVQRVGYRFGGTVSFQFDLDFRSFTDRLAPPLLGWETLSTTGVPRARGDASYVYLGSPRGFYLFGGWSYSGVWGDLYHYNPDTSAWSPLTAGGAPADRQAHSATALTSSQMLIFGGKRESGGLANDLYVYNASGGSWGTMNASGSAPTARWYAGMVTIPHLSSQRVLVFGGETTGNTSSSANPSNGLWILDPDTPQWHSVAMNPAPPPRWGHLMVYDPATDRTVVSGGKDPSGQRIDSWELDCDLTALTCSASEMPTSQSGHPTLGGRMAGYYDPDLESIVTFATGAGGQTVWTLQRGSERVPAHMLEVPFTEIGLGGEFSLSSVTIHAVAGGRSGQGTACSTLDGARLSVWLWGRWVDATYNLAGADTPEPLEYVITDPEILRGLQTSDDQTLLLAVSPLAGSDCGDTPDVARLAYVEVEAQYDHSTASPRLPDKYVVGSAGDWTTARSECQGLGGDLATVKGELGMLELDSVLDRTTSYWIGYHDQNTEGVWEWVDGTTGEDRTGSEVVSYGYSDWSSGEPNDSGGSEDVTHIVANQTNQWNDATGAAAYEGICELYE